VAGFTAGKCLRQPEVQYLELVLSKRATAPKHMHRIDELAVIDNAGPNTLRAAGIATMAPSLCKAGLSSSAVHAERPHSARWRAVVLFHRRKVI
jgi:hypothetical protein